MIYKKGNIGVSIAIVVAALIIGGAVIFTNNNSDNKKDEENKSTIAQADPSKVKPIDEKDWVYGNIDAPIGIVEYSDTECPFCSFLHPDLKRIVDENSGQVVWAYRHFPIIQLHPIAPTVSHASECIGELKGNDSFWGFIDKIYQLSYNNLTLEKPKDKSAHAENPKLLTDYAVELGVDVNAFNQCMADSRHQDRVTEDYQNATVAGGGGTPYSVIILPEEMTDEQKTAVDALASSINRPGQRPNIIVSNSKQHIGMSGALPYEIWNEILKLVK